MAKIHGLFGSMTGKLADVVMAVRNGEQIARKYQPIVFNPSTPAQIAQRAKLKLMSQLSAVMAPVIAIPRQGTVSGRNLFTKKNFGLLAYSDDTASVDLNKVQLTSSVVGLPDIIVTRGEDSAVEVKLSQSLVGFDKMVYASFLKQTDGTLRLFDTSVINAPGTNARWPWETALAPNAEAVYYAYGIRLNNENARAIFGNMTVTNAEAVAKLLVTKTLTESDVTLTETRGVTLAPVSNREGDENNHSTKTKK